LDPARGCIPAVRDDGRDLLRLIHDSFDREDHLFVGHQGRHPGQVRRLEVLAADYREGTRDLQRLLDVDVPDAGVRVRTSDDVEVEHPGEFHVVHVVPLAADEAGVLLPLHGLADAAVHGHGCPPPEGPAILFAACWIAFTIFTYPVQRHRFPEIARRICSSVGCRFFWSNATEHIIIPGVQKPHWSPCSSTKPSWTGWSLPSVSRPSTVRTSRLSAWTARIVQDLTALPSRRIVHAPQLVVSQPMWVPVRLRFSRRKWTSRLRVSTVADRGAPFTVTWTFMKGPVSSSPALVISVRTISCTPVCPSRGPMQGPESKDPDHRPFVFGGTPQVRNRARDLLREFRGSPEGSILRRLADEMPLRFRRLERGRADRREREARGFDGPFRREHEVRGDPDDREVADSLLELHIRIALARPRLRNLDFQEEFIRLERGDEGVLVEFFGWDRPRSGRAADNEVGPQGEHAGGEIVRRISMGDVPADRPHVPHEGIRDFVGRIGEDGIASVNEFGIVQV